MMDGCVFTGKMFQTSRVESSEQRRRRRRASEVTPALTQRLILQMRGNGFGFTALTHGLRGLSGLCSPSFFT